MPLPVRFHPEALLELKDGASFYGERPYAIVYAIDRAAIFVVAVEHTKRRPGYWLGRH